MVYSMTMQIPKVLCYHVATATVELPLWNCLWTGDQLQRSLCKATFSFAYTSIYEIMLSSITRSPQWLLISLCEESQYKFRLNIWVKGPCIVVLFEPCFHLCGNVLSVYIPSNCAVGSFDSRSVGSMQLILVKPC